MIDIYFNKEWLKLFADRDGLELETFQFESESGRAEYIFGKRKIIIQGQEYPYFDIVTPYAFSGPVFEPAEDTEECRMKLADQYEEAFQSYCLEHDIVAEFVQFNPWVQNSKYLEKSYEMDFRSKMIGINLTRDIWKDELNPARRRAIKKALNYDLELIYDSTGEYIEEFVRLYDFTIKKYNATDYYRFDADWIRHLFYVLPDNIEMILVKHNGIFINATICLKEGDYAHGFIAGNDPSYSSLNGNSFLLYKAAEKMKMEGRKLFMLGGGDGALLVFKNSFTKNAYYDYYSGKKIRNPEKYQEFTKINGVEDTRFFPAYRDNGKVKYKHWEEEEEE